MNHVLWQCKLHETERQILIKELKKLKLQLPLSVEMLLVSPHIEVFKCIVKFLKKCNLKT